MLLNLISANSFIKNNNGDGFWVKISITPKCELFLVKKTFSCHGFQFQQIHSCESVAKVFVSQESLEADIALNTL